MTELLYSGSVSPPIHTLVSVLLDIAIKGTVVLLAAAGIALTLRRASASVQHFVWALALLGLVALPAVTVILPSWRVAVLPEVTPVVEVPDEGTFNQGYATLPASPLPRGVSAATDSPETTTAPLAVVAEPATVAAPALEPSHEEARAPTHVLPLAIAGIWLAGLVLCLLPYLLGTVRLHRLCRTATGVPRTLQDDARRSREILGMSGAVQLLLSDRIAIPMTWGLLRPTVLLPWGFSAWEPARRQAVFLHEFAHAQRRDCLTQLLGRIGVAVHWFNPLAWIAESRLKIESERACDDLVLRAGSPADDYANCLVEIARSLKPSGRRLAAAIAMAQPSRLEGRVLAILDLGRRRSPMTRNAQSVAAILALFAFLPLAALRITAADSGEDGEEVAPRSDEALSVAADGSGGFTSVQKAIDAAAEGAVVRIGPGVYKEHLVLRKPLTLEGAGWSRTVVTSIHEFNRELLAEIQKRMRAAETEAERQAIRAEVIDQYGKNAYTLTVNGARGVVLKDLKITLQGPSSEERISPGATVNLVRSDAKLSKCVIAGSPGHGINIQGGSNVEVRECLVAGVSGSGIYVDQGVDSGRVRIVESDIRNCRHRGIQVRKGGESTAIERCRVSGSAWHGIRYDHSAPLVTGNLIFDNERCGIYSSGRTAATVEENLFFANGITCWFESRDTIQGNTFVNMHGDTYAGDSQGVCILGAAKPKIRKNIFADLETGVYIGNTSRSKSDGTANLEGNLFWKTGRKLAWSRPDSEATEPEPLPVDGEKGNREGDPGFVKADALDFSLPQNSPLREQKIGAADHLSFESPWPLQPEEGVLIARRAEREEERAGEASRAEAYVLAKTWIEDLQQIRDRATRDAAVEKMRAALGSGDPVQTLAGLKAFLATLEVNYDKSQFRELILPLARSADGETRVSAFYALCNASKNPEDIELVFAALDASPSRSLLRSASHLLSMYTKGDLTGRAGDTVLALLESDNRDNVRETLRGIWGARVTPGIEQRLIELAAKGSESRHDAIYFGLSTLENKSKNVIEALFEAIEDPDHNNAGRALWGLGHGVPEENHALVADFLVDVIDARGNARVRSDCLDMLERYGNTSHIEALLELAENDLLGEKLREKARQAVGRIQKRAERE